MTQSQIHGSGGGDENDEPLIDQNSGQIQASIASSDDLLDEIDLVRLAVAVDAALGGDGVMPGEEIDDGKQPDELNAANDG